MPRLISSTLLRFLLALGVVAAVDFGCSDSRPPMNSPSTTLTSVAIVPASATVQIGGVQPFSAIVSPSGASPGVAWSVAGGLRWRKLRND